MKRRIVVVSHCFLNDAAKLINQNPIEEKQERKIKRDFLVKALSSNIEIIQLPCPEQLIYGCNRWGHATSQFDTPHFRSEVRKMLTPTVAQISEYYRYTERYEVLGVIGINGSPSCGVEYTFDGAWGGEIGSIESDTDLAGVLKKTNDPGIFMREFQQMLKEEQCLIPFYSLESFAYDLLL